jgi:hypothetical protein
MTTTISSGQNGGPGPDGPDDRRLHRSVLILAMSLVSVGVVVVAAVLSFTATNHDNTFSTGNVHLTLTPATALFTSPNMAPGDFANHSIHVDNDGSLALRYAITGLTTASTDGTAPEPDDPTANTVAAALRLTIRSGVSPEACDVDTAVTTGAIHYGPAALSAVTTPLPLVGSAAAGQDGVVGTVGADRVLAAASAEDLCFTVVLPTADTASGGLGVTVSWNFVAEQTINNPDRR